jgi:hypothetical protein
MKIEFGTKKRLKKVFPTQEVIHKWANETQAEGRNAQGNVFFDGKSLYSYGSHYEMGRHVSGRKGEKVVFLNDEPSSVTTEKHKSWAGSSVPGDRVSFQVISFEKLGVNLLYIMGNCKKYLESANRARQNKLYLLNRAKKEKELSIKYFGLFSDRLQLDTVKLYKAFLRKWDEKQFQLDILDGQAKKEKADEKERVNREASAKKYELLRIERAKEEVENLQKWKDGENVATRFSYTRLAFLRVKGDQVETSQGARVSIKGAKVLYKLILAGKEIRAFDLEGFKVLGLTDEGQSLKVGCHVVALSEIHRIGEELETVTEPETVPPCEFTYRRGFRFWN